MADPATLARAAAITADLSVGSVSVDQGNRSLTAPVAGGPAVLIEALRRMDAESITLTDVGLRRPTLDDVFLILTGHSAADEPAGKDSGMSILAPIQDAVIVARRNVIKIRRVPELLVFTTASPIMFILLFAFVFAGAIGDGSNPRAYREFLIAGIFAQNVIFGSTITGAGLAEDVKRGIIDRFRSLPMAPSAVLTGRTFSDVVINMITLVVMSLTGLLVGWRVRGSLIDALAAYALLLLFAYAFSWIMAWIGLLVPDPDVVNQASFIVIFPITFIANTFVPVETLPAVLRVFAEWNPVSALTQATRELLGNDLTMGAAPTVWPLQHPVLYVLIWTVIILAIFVPLTNAQYRRATAR